MSRYWRCGHCKGATVLKVAETEGGQTSYATHHSLAVTILRYGRSCRYDSCEYRNQGHRGAPENGGIAQLG
jgi:hypothetical protein